MRDIPVFVINGFLESGKTTLINETLRDTDFNDGGKTLLLLLEEGIEEYDEKDMKKLHVDIVTFDSLQEMTRETLSSLQKQYKPQRVMIEYNGTWNMSELLQKKLPNGWTIVQILTMVDASTFDNYWNNMRSVMGEQMKYSDVIIFNRCTKDTDKAAIRRQIKPLNRRGQIIYEAMDGEVLKEEEEKPFFDLSMDPIVIEDDDFGLWYMDALDYRERYEGKRVQFTGMVYRDPKCEKDFFIPGRLAMTCCADDVAFIGFLCKITREQQPMVLVAPKEKKWVKVTARVGYEYRKEYRAEGPVLVAMELIETKAPEEELVYFN